MFQENKLLNSLEMFKVFFWLKKLLKSIFRGKPSKMAIEHYRYTFRLVMERNIPKCRIAWVLYNTVEHVGCIYAAVWKRMGNKNSLFTAG